MAGHTIKAVLSNNDFRQNDVNYVVTQIEAKHLCNKKTHSAIDEERGLHLYLTNKCNLCCPHCYMYSGKAYKDELTTEEVLRLISEYRLIAKGGSVTLSGGEPTSRPDFDTIVKKSSDLGLEVKILTNGVLMTPERIDKLAKYIYSVQVSIDGFSEESNSKIRGKGNFGKAMSAVNEFLRHGVNTAIAITPPMETLHNNIEDYVAFAQTLKDRHKGEPLRIKFTEELLQGRNLSPSKKDAAKYFRLMEEIQRRIYGPDFKVMSFVHSLQGNAIIDNCTFGNLAVASNGDVYFCARICDLPPIGNIRELSFQEIYRKSIKAEKASSISNLKPCCDCELRYICGGGCRIEEFPELTKRTSFDDFDKESIPPMACPQSTKNGFYDLMIRSNKYFYAKLD